MGSFLGIPDRQVEGEPGWEDLAAGLRRAYSPFISGVEAPTQAPSRGTMTDMARTDGAEDPKDRDKKLREEYAKNQAERNARGEDPRNIRQTDTRVPRDPPRAPVGTGTDLQPKTSHSPSTRESRGEALQGDSDYAVVRMPDGRVVVNRDPTGAMASGGRMDPPGGRSNVVAGAAGTAFSSPEKALIGQGGADMSKVNLPTDEDRSAGWATRAAINELSRKGELSMNPRDIMDRRRWEEQETARDMGRERAEMEQMTLARQASIDPYRMAEIEAQGKYGGQAITQENESQRIMAALTYYAQISQQINSIEEQMRGMDQEAPRYAELKSAHERLIQERREMPNLAMGFKLQDPKLDPLSALVGLIGGGSSAKTEGGI